MSGYPLGVDCADPLRQEIDVIHFAMHLHRPGSGGMAGGGFVVGFGAVRLDDGVSTTRKITLLRPHAHKLLDALTAHHRGGEDKIAGTFGSTPEPGTRGGVYHALRFVGLTPEGHTYMQFGRSLHSGGGWNKAAYVVLSAAERATLIRSLQAAWRSRPRDLVA